MKRIIYTYPFIVCLILGSLALASCSEFLEADPPKTQVVSATVFNDDFTATSALAGIYATMMSGGSFASGGPGSMTIQAGLSSDEYLNLSLATASLQFSSNSLVPTNTTVTAMWADLYRYIFYANSALEGIRASKSLSSSVRSQLEGEALFIRAFSHFYLTNLFGNVPIAITTDYKINSTALRSAQAEVYSQIINDLKQASQLMKDDYSHASGERVRPNKYAALALLARVYLFTEQWDLAASASSQVIEATSLYKLENNLNNVFLKNSNEAIWQLMPIMPQVNTNEGTAFWAVSYASISSELEASFEPDDERYNQWTTIRTSGANGYRIPFKYKIGTTGQPLSEYSMVLRLAELYLIRAEARTHLSNTEGALADLNAIRMRTSLPEKHLTDQDEILDAISNERRIELFSEWGHRWLDLKRTQMADQVLAPLKPDWQKEDALYPIPKTERDNNPNLNQNQGY